MPKRGRRGEKQEYDFMHTTNQTTRSAPFGTSDTPNLVPKLIKGKMVHVIEGGAPTSPRLHGQPVYTGPRLHNLDEVTGKPNEVDPRILNESTRGYYTAQQITDDPNNEKYTYRKLPTLDQYSSHVHGKPTNANPISYRSRPDSKALQRYESLPPIDAHRDRNNDSTVFENEVWIKGPAVPKLSKETEYNKHFESYNSNTLHSERRDQSYPNSERKFTPRDSYNDAEHLINGHDYPNSYKRNSSDPVIPPAMNSIKAELCSYLPPNNSLPTDPIRFNSRQKQDLVDIAAEELKRVTTDDLKGAYQTLSKYDRNLTGWAPFGHMYDALCRERANPEQDTLRCIASMFVNPLHQGLVNYEEIIKFMNDVIKQSHTDVRNISFSRERDTAVLLQRIANKLGTNRIDIERLVQSFQRYDSDRREMLSVSEIRSVLFDNLIQLDDELLSELLLKIESSNRDGQYSWRKLVEFLERVKPARTSLEISYNKKPLEMARQYPQPLDSWPHAKESPRVSPPPYSRSPRSPIKQNWHNNGIRPYGPSRTSSEFWRQIHSIEEEIKELEEEQKVLRQGLESDYRGEDWDNKLIKLAGFLYRKDEDKYRASGFLPYDQITDHTKSFNQYASMRVPDYVIEKLADRYKNERNMVDIAKFLDALGDRRRWS